MEGNLDFGRKQVSVLLYKRFFIIIFNLKWAKYVLTYEKKTRTTQRCMSSSLYAFLLRNLYSIILNSPFFKHLHCTYHTYLASSAMQEIHKRNNI